uniref:Protein msta n=1 Tax=Anoplophora glabripennis TaxID=217634 RepID=V5I9L0_ANOGL
MDVLRFGAKVCYDEILGRHLKATRDIKPGEVVLQEPPLIWGPAQVTVPVCLGCGNAVTEKNSRPCFKCGWPVCNETCEKAPGHIPECRYTVLRGDRVSVKNFGVVHPIYQCITVLRCLYQKQFLPEVWKKLDTLQSHCEERKGTQKYEQEKVTIAQFILRFFKLANVFTEEEIMRVCGIVMINSHEVPLTEPPHVAIYESTSMFEHNCSANCTKSFTNKGGVLVAAGTHIKKGDNLCICYTDPLWGTSNRRHHLYQSKFFWCNCKRCQDTTEFGTFFSSLKCQNSPCNGYLLPKTFIEKNNNEKGSDWTCTKCTNVFSAYSAQDLLERIGKDLSDMPKGVSQECKNFIKDYESLLHPNHFYLTDVRLALSQIIGQEGQGGLPAVSDEDLELKARLCQGLVNLFKTLIPGETRVRGLLMFELHASIAEIGRRKGDPGDLHTLLLESKNVLTEAADLLKHEPDFIPEGKIYKQAVSNLKELEFVLRTVHKTVGDSPM